MNKIFMLFVAFFGIFNLNAQSCFEAYDQIFANGAEKLSYTEFHKREQAFLDGLIACTAPDFSVVSMDKEEIILAELKGKVVVLNFWFTTCLPCLKEIPLLNIITEEYSSDEVVFIGMARDNVEVLDKFFKRFGSFKYKIIPESHLIADAYKVIAWPQSMIIDKNGNVFKAWAGTGDSPNDLVEHIQEAIDDCLTQE